ncbi:MAG TPA: hypothetical protein PK096_03385 [Candidatus Saccharibacteria bacterium]|nr:hypothetical protein [Candidatus Saccharibacteria bacterium]HRK94386.1 hypothetical protein [Candidatus Saccharibacteria bacterium]
MLTNFLKSYHKQIEWLLGIVVVVLAVVAWSANRDLTDSLTIYDIFPPLGLVAFGLMWTHFVMGAIRRYGRIDSPKESAYKTVSFGIVLGLLILHPGLLVLGLYRDGYGPPPFSYIEVYSTQLLAVGMGSIGLTIFLAFELKRWFSEKSWWKYIEWAQLVGMAAIFYHALQLGGELKQPWFVAVWWFYGLTLVLAVGYTKFVSMKKGKSYGEEVV